jgi:hypothetical protein
LFFDVFGCGCAKNKKKNITVIGLFSGTSSAILNYTIQIDLLTDQQLEKVSPSREGNEFFYPRGSKVFEPFFTLNTIGVFAID